MREYSLVIPTQYDDTREDIPRQAFAELESKLLTLAGGYSVSPCRGAWRADSGIVIEDAGLRYTVAVEGSQGATLLRLLSIARDACGMFRQQCIYLSTAGRSVLVYRTTNTVELFTGLYS